MNFKGSTAYKGGYSVCAGLILALYGFATTSLPAQVVNSWSNPGSGAWEGASNWSLGIRPAANQTISIANGGYKAVSISSSTASGFPASMTVNNLSVSAPSNALSVLLLNYAGTTVPLHVLDVGSIGANGSLQNFYSSLQVDGSNGVYYGGPFVITDGGQFIQEGGLTVITPTTELRNGNINATNATMNWGGFNMGDNSTGRPGNVTQSGGTVQIKNLRMDIGRYTLMDNGTLYSLDSTILYQPSADFEQISGTNYGDVEVLAGLYKLHDGLLHGNNLSTTGDPSGGEGFFQYGGTAEFSTIEVQGPESGAYAWISYSFQAGALHCGTLSISGVGSMQELGGTMTLTNGLDLEHGTFNLYGGSLSMPSLVVSNAGRFSHIDGINTVAGDVALYNTTLKFQAGRFSSANLGVGVGAPVDQSSGSNEVSGVLSITGSYSMGSGVLTVNGVYLRGSLTIDTAPFYPPSLFLNRGLINFGGTLNVSASQNSMGQVLLAKNGTINLGASQMVLRFADSSALTWDANSMLVIAGWNGAYSGNGGTQIYFGNNSGGLTPSQVAQVRFLDPGGRKGYYLAQILPTGEVVPGPTIQSSRFGNQLVLTWSGNYQLLTATEVLGPYTVISGATSPYTNDVRSAPRRFFMLRGQ